MELDSRIVELDSKYSGIVELDAGIVELEFGIAELEFGIAEFRPFSAILYLLLYLFLYPRGPFCRFLKAVIVVYKYIFFQAPLQNYKYISKKKKISNWKNPFQKGTIFLGGVSNTEI